MLRCAAFRVLCQGTMYIISTLNPGLTSLNYPCSLLQPGHLVCKYVCKAASAAAIESQAMRSSAPSAHHASARVWPTSV